jgi:hypothetical protein
LILLELSPVVSRHRVALSYPVLMHFGGDSGGNFQLHYRARKRSRLRLSRLARAMCDDRQA